MCVQVLQDYNRPSAEIKFYNVQNRWVRSDSTMAAVPTAVPVVMGVPAQLEMDGGKSPLDASGFQSADVHQWDGQPWQVVGEDSQTLLATLQPGQVRTCLRSRLCSTYSGTHTLICVHTCMH